VQTEDTSDREWQKSKHMCGVRPAMAAAWLDRRFSVTASGSTIRRELAAGLTTFVTAGYILTVNPVLVNAGLGAGDGSSTH
jgi:hypothetical protein